MANPPPPPSYGISLSPTGTLTFPPAIAGYGAYTPELITVENTGNQPTGDLKVANDDPFSFVLNSYSIPSIDVGSTTTFTVGLVPGLRFGHRYNANIRVWGDHGIDKTISVEVYIKYPWE